MERKYLGENLAVEFQTSQSIEVTYFIIIDEYNKKVEYRSKPINIIVI